jgi:hypothetical protein
LGCVEAVGVEVAIQVAVDAAYNLCVAREGYEIVAVLASSWDAVHTQLHEMPENLHATLSLPDGLDPLPDLLYPPSTRVFVVGHLKFMGGGGVEENSKTVMSAAQAFACLFRGGAGLRVPLPRVW